MFAFGNNLQAESKQSETICRTVRLTFERFGYKSKVIGISVLLYIIYI